MHLPFCFAFKKNEGPKDDTEVDNLEAEYRRKRGTSGYTSQPQQDPEKIKTYDPNLETNHYETKGSYTLRLVGQRRLSGRERRSMGQTDFTNMLESSLLGFINES